VGWSSTELMSGTWSENHSLDWCWIGVGVIEGVLEWHWIGDSGYWSQYGSLDWCWSVAGAALDGLQWLLE
jgi:hypothetical protein